MLSFEHATPAFRTWCGPDAIAALPRELERQQASRAMIVCGRSVAGAPDLLERLESCLGGRLAGRFDGVRAHSPIPSVMAAAAELDRLAADSVIAVGGGSAVVTARAAVIAVAEKQPIRALCTHRGPDGRLISPKLLAPKLPIWVVATTPTTAYAKAGSAVHDPDGGDRLALFDPKTRARGLFLDPRFAASAPDALVESASLNALAMAVAALESPVDDPLAEALLRQALDILVTALPAIRDPADPMDRRLRLMAAALLCGQGTDFMGAGACAAISHAVGPFARVANGYVDGVLLPHVVRFNASHTRSREGRLRAALGVAHDATVADAIAARLAHMPIPHRLRDLGVARDALPALASRAADDWSLQRNPRPAGTAELEAILHAAW